MGPAETAETADGVSALQGGDLCFRCAVRDAVHHLEAAGNAAQSDGFSALCDHGSFCRTGIDGSAEASADHEAAALSDVLLNDAPG